MVGNLHELVTNIALSITKDHFNCNQQYHFIEGRGKEGEVLLNGNCSNSGNMFICLIESNTYFSLYISSLKLYKIRVGKTVILRIQKNKLKKKV